MRGRASHICISGSANLDALPRDELRTAASSMRASRAAHFCDAGQRDEVRTAVPDVHLGQRNFYMPYAERFEVGMQRRMNASNSGQCDADCKGDAWSTKVIQGDEFNVLKVGMAKMEE